MSPTPADRLRQRASALRALARTLHGLKLLTLSTVAGPHTWVGPSPQACSDDLDARRRLMFQAADELRREAARFERIAADLDARHAVAGLG